GPAAKCSRSIESASYVEAGGSFVVLDRKATRLHRVRVRLRVGHGDGERGRGTRCAEQPVERSNAAAALNVVIDEDDCRPTRNCRRSPYQAFEDLVRGSPIASGLGLDDLALHREHGDVAEPHTGERAAEAKRAEAGRLDGGCGDRRRWNWHEGDRARIV